MNESELSTLHSNLGKYIGHQFELWTGNDDLMKSCCLIASRINVDQDEASSIIIKELWNLLQEKHRSRLIK